MSRTLPRFIAAALFAAALPLAAHAATQAEEKDSKGGSPTDAGFVTNASGGGLAEIELGKLAQTHGGSAKVKAFGKQMVEDHTKAGEELKSLAAGDRGYSTAEAVPPSDQKDVNALERLKGAEFDKEYAKVMVADHQKTIAIFSAEAEKGSNKDLQAFARKTLPTLKEHLKMARALDSAK
jgi:putative membrane protein